MDRGLLLCIKDRGLASLQLFVTSTVIPFGSRTSLGSVPILRAVNTPAKISKRIARKRASLSSWRLLTRHNKSVFRNALDGHCARWSGACVLTGVISSGGTHDGRVVHLQSDSALGTKHGDALQETLREGR